MTEQAYAVLSKFYTIEKARDERARILVEVILTRCDGITRDAFAEVVCEFLAAADVNDPLTPPTAPEQKK